MSRCIKSLKKLKSMVGKEVKVCTLENVKGICLVTEDNAGDTCLISKDKALLETRYFWEIQGERQYIKNCTAEYVAGHYCWRKHQLIEELKWVTSSVPHKKTAKTVKAKPAKETKETRDDAFRPLNIEQLKEHIPCHVLLKDDQVAYVEYEKDTPVVYMQDTVYKLYGWPTRKKDGYKYGWYINDEEDFESVFETFEHKLAQSAESVETAEPSLYGVFKEILETLKEIKNEIAKR